MRIFLIFFMIFFQVSVLKAETVQQQKKIYQNYKKNYQNYKRQFVEYDFRTADHSLSGRKAKILLNISSDPNYKVEYNDVLDKHVDLIYSFRVSNELDCRYPKLDLFVMVLEKKCLLDNRLITDKCRLNKLKNYCSKSLNEMDEYLKSSMNNYLTHFDAAIKVNQRKHFSCDRLDRDLTDLREYAEKELKNNVKNMINSYDFDLKAFDDCDYYQNYK